MNDVKYLKRHQDELNGTNSIITPICIVVDRSGSMGMEQFADEFGKTRMDRLNEGIKLFIEEIRNDDILADSVEVSIIGFTDDIEDEPEFPPVEEILKFSTIDNIGDITITNSNRAGDTPLGVEKALDVLEKEKQFLKENKTRYNQPWIVIFSDGRATPSAKWKKENGSKDFSDIKARLKDVQEKTKELERNRKLTVIPVLITETDDSQFESGYRQMRGFSAEDRALVLCRDPKYNPDSLSFKDFFKILGKSVSVSNADLMFKGSSSDKYNRDIEFKPESYVNKEQVERYLMADAKGSTKKVIRNLKLVILLPDEINADECLRVSYNQPGDETYEAFSDETDNISLNATIAMAALELADTTNEISLKIDICEKGSHKILVALDDSSYRISGPSLMVDLSDRGKRRILEDESADQEPKTEISQPADGDASEKNYEEEAAKPLPKAKTKVDTSTADDDYLNNLLNGIDDWDNI